MFCFAIYVHSLGVLCPADSKGINVPSGCKCNAGFAGNVVASSIAPYFISSCKAVKCPLNSFGANLPSGCTCNAGYSGSLVASENPPLFYTGPCSCTPVPSGINVKSTDGLYTYLKWESNANAGFALPLSCAISIDYLLVA